MKLYAGTLLLLFTVSSLIIPAHAFTSQPSLLIADDSLAPDGGIAIAPLNSPTPSEWFSDSSGVISEETDLVSDGTYVYVIYQGTGSNPVGISKIDIATKTLVSTLQLPSDGHFDSENSFLNGIDRDSFGNLFVVAQNPDFIGAVYKYDVNDDYVGAYYGNSTNQDYFSDPSDVAVDSSDNVWILDYGKSNIFFLSQINNSTTGLMTPPELSTAQQMTFINPTTVAVTDFYDPQNFKSQILTVDVPSGTSSILSSDLRFKFLTGLAFNSTSNVLYVVDQDPFNTPTIYSINYTNPTNINIVSSGTPLKLPLGMILENIKIPNANVKLIKSGPEFIADGHQFNYTITISNDGPDPVSDVTIKDTPPLGVLFQASEPPGVCLPKATDPPTVDCTNIGTITNGGSITITLTFEINTSQPPLLSDFPLINKAKISTGAIGNSLSDDEDSTKILGIISGEFCNKNIKDYNSVILGTKLDDNLVGTNNDDLIIGLGGNDSIDGFGGNDCLIGDNTNDHSIQGKDTIRGGDGDDEIHGGSGGDNLYGDSGSDTIFGDDGGDIIYGGIGNDSIKGGGGDDDIFGEQGDDTIFGNDGLDDIDGGSEIDACNVGETGEQLGTVTKCEANLSISISDNPDPVTVGGSITYSVSVSNSGPSNATSVSLPIILDSTLSISGSITSGSFTCIPSSLSGPIQCTLSKLDYTDPPQIISFTVLTGVTGTATTSTSITSSDFDDQDTSNNSAQAQTTVNPANTPPIAINDFFTILQDSANNNFNVLANDTDADNDTLFVSSVSTPSNGGTAVINGTNNGIIYTPAPGYFGPETFTYFATDGQATSPLPATITVTVKQTFCGLPESAFDHVIYGTPGNDNIVGTQDNDLIFGLAGNDKIKGLKGDDCIFGGDGDDKINGNKGDDTIFGGDGDDKINGNKGDDTIFGGDGDDKINGNKGDDTLSGDDGKDKIYGGNGDDFIDGGNQIDKCKGGKGNNTIINCEEKPKEKEDKQKDDKSDCDCKKPSIFTVSLSGTSSAESVEIFSKENYVGNDDKILTQLDIDGVNIVINSEDDLNQNYLESNTVYRILDSDGNEIDVVSIHTSCSQPLYVGQQFTGQNHIVTLTVVSGTDLAGNLSIPDDQCKVKDDNKKEKDDDKKKK